MHVVKLAAFSDGDTGGNPAGVVVAPELPSAEEMQGIAAEVGFSETAFAAPIPPIAPIAPIPLTPGTETAPDTRYRVRYFSPESEVPFCGHATIALAAVLAREKGDGLFQLQLNDAAITVEGRREGRLYHAALQSPPTRSVVAPRELAQEFLDLFGYKGEELDPRLPPAVAHAGANHFVIGLATRAGPCADEVRPRGRTAAHEPRGGRHRRPRLGGDPAALPHPQPVRLRRRLRGPGDGSRHRRPRRLPARPRLAGDRRRRAARSKSCKARTWGCAPASPPSSPTSPAAPSASPAPCVGSRPRVARPATAVSASGARTGL